MHDSGPPDDLPVIRPVAIAHQEGILAVVALVGLWFRNAPMLTSLAATAPTLHWVFVSLAVAAGGFGLLWALRAIPAVRTLERWQRAMVAEWSLVDALAVAVISGLAEEALVRALLQPWLGLLPAAFLFALLHVVPDRRLWAWPVTALVLGVAFGILFERFGYPAAALAHIALNAGSLIRLRHNAERVE